MREIEHDPIKIRRQTQQFETTVYEALKTTRAMIAADGSTPLCEAAIAAMTLLQAGLIAQMPDQDRRELLDKINQALRRVVRGIIGREADERRAG